VYTAFAAARSDTGCSTVLIPCVDESAMVAPDVVGLSIAALRHFKLNLLTLFEGLEAVALNGAVVNKDV
jgi:hypothetical protein